jgi:thioredoxin reductase (NADPH)
MGSAPEAAPQLSAAQLGRVIAFGVAQQVRAGDVVFRPGDAAYDLIVIESGRVQILSPATRDEPEAVLAEYGAGGFLGELNLLTGQTAYLSARVTEAGTIHRLGRDQFHRLMAEHADVSDVLLRAFLTRRDALRQSSAAHLLEIVGHGASAAALGLRTYAARQRLPHLWLDADSVAGRALMQLAPLTVADLPAVLTPDRTLRDATPADVADALGLTYRASGASIADLVIVGAGPAGLAAAVTAASEGLSVTLVDSDGPGGQAAGSSRIENYVGFPTGISGHDLMQRATLQAMKFGTRLFAPCTVESLVAVQDTVQVGLVGGQTVDARAAVIATGVHYRRLALPGWDRLEQAGIYYAATELESAACAGAPVTVIGGANSAGQAALLLAGRAGPVTLVVRAADLRAGMSSYLADRVRADPRIEVHTSTEVTTLGGNPALAFVELTDRTSGAVTRQSCHALFCFIGARPNTGWASGVRVDEDGFVLTGVDLNPAERSHVWADLERDPLPYETSVANVFAAGDVRAGSVKRVASAVGEGSSAIRSVLAVVGVPF